MSTFGLDKPTKLPRWGTDQSNETEPSSGQKDTGWVFEQIPPSSFQNWLDRISYDWFSWTDERLAPPSEGTGANSDDSLQIHDPADNVANTDTGNRGVTKLILEGVLSADKVAAETVTAFPGGAVIEASGATWQTASVAVNDVAVVAGTPGDDGVYLISAIPAEDQLTLKLLTGAAFTLNGGTPGGTVTVKAKSTLKAIAPGGLEVKQSLGADAWVVKAPSDTFGGDKDWIFPSSLPSTGSRLLSIDDTGQVSIGKGERVVTVGDGITTFGDFNGTNHTPIASAISDVVANGGYVKVLEGTYVFTATITLPVAGVKVLIVGGINATDSSAPGTADWPIFELGAGAFEFFEDGGTVTTDFEMRHIRLDTNDASERVGFSLTNVAQNSHVDFRFCVFESGAAGRHRINNHGGQIRFFDCQYSKFLLEAGTTSGAQGKTELHRCTGSLSRFEINADDCLFDSCDLINDDIVLQVNGTTANPDTKRLRLYRNIFTNTDEGGVMTWFSSAGNPTAPEVNTGFGDIQSNWFRSLGDAAAGPGFSVVVWGASHCRWVGNRISFENIVAQAERKGLDLNATGAFASVVINNSFIGTHIDALLTGSATGSAVFIETNAIGVSNGPKKIYSNSFVGLTLGRDFTLFGLAKTWHIKVSADGANIALIHGNTITGCHLGGGITFEKTASGGTEGLIDNVVVGNAHDSAGSGFTYIGVANAYENSTDIARLHSWVSSASGGFTARELTDTSFNQSGSLS